MGLLIIGSFFHTSRETKEKFHSFLTRDKFREVDFVLLNSSENTSNCQNIKPLNATDINDYH